MNEYLSIKGLEYYNDQIQDIIADKATKEDIQYINSSLSSVMNCKADVNQVYELAEELKAVKKV